MEVHPEENTDFEAPGLDTSARTAMDPRLRARVQLISDYEHLGNFILRLGIDDAEKPLPTHALGRISKALDSGRWNPDIDLLIQGLSTNEIMSCLLLMQKSMPREQLAQSFCNFSGLHEELFKKAICLPDQCSGKDLNHDVQWRLRAYSLLNGMNRPLDQMRIREILDNNAVSSAGLAEQVANDYKAYWFCVKDPNPKIAQEYDTASSLFAGFGDFFNPDDYLEHKPFRLVTTDNYYGSVYMDTPAGILLSYKQIPQAVISFMPSVQEPRTLTIQQIQGLRPLKPESQLGRPARYSVRGIARLKWEQALVQIAEDVAKNLGYQCLEIVAAENIAWVENGTIGLSNAKRRYDQTAGALGFEKVNDQANFQKKL